MPGHSKVKIQTFPRLITTHRTFSSPSPVQKAIRQPWGLPSPICHPTFCPRGEPWSFNVGKPNQPLLRLSPSSICLPGLLRSTYAQPWNLVPGVYTTTKYTDLKSHLSWRHGRLPPALFFSSIFSPTFFLKGNQCTVPHTCAHSLSKVGITPTAWKNKDAR